jgi:hypothetical protein
MKNISSRSILSDPFAKLAQRIREELGQTVPDGIRYKPIEFEKGRDLAWTGAWNEWAQAHREEPGEFFNKTIPGLEQALPGNLPTNVARIARPQTDVRR